ncbi:MAG: HAMP domain-containing protein [Firmicutes bacterium]|nr:methyl-accepting chemotaxis protein [Bacillota bacterium]NLL89132.1 HAMP domain-containing protein [Bacillota bacterium]
MKWSNLNIGGKIAIGFVMVLLLIFGLGVTDFFGLLEIRDQSGFVLDICTLGYDFAQREIDHLLWVAALRDSIEARDPNFTIELDPTRCQLGRWLGGDERKEMEAAIPGLAPIIAGLEEEHRHLHNSAGSIRASLTDAPDQAETIFKTQTQLHLEEIRAGLNGIKQQLQILGTESTEEIAGAIAAGINRSGMLLLTSVVIGTVMSWLITRSIIRPIRLLNHAMLTASEGDLTITVDYDANDETGRMVKLFNKMLSNLNSIIGASKTAVTETVSSSQTMSAAVEEVSSSIEQVATSATQFASSVTAISDHTQRINEEAQETGRMAKVGTERITSCMESMLMIEEASDTTSQAIASLKEASQEIVKIVQVVTDIADQTNLLSLNAAIEAARAGEYGHGFAVVAEEVRKLAEQTKTNLQEVNHLVANLETQMNTAVESTNISREKVHQGALVVKETTESLQNIVKRITDIMEQLKIISDRTQEQAALSQEIAAMTEEQSAATHGIAQSSVDLANIAQNLEDVIKRLNV